MPAGGCFACGLGKPHTPAKLSMEFISYDTTGRIGYRDFRRHRSCKRARENNFVVYTKIRRRGPPDRGGILPIPQTGLKEWEKSAAVENLTLSEDVKRASLTLRHDQRECYRYPAILPLPKARFPARRQYPKEREGGRCQGLRSNPQGLGFDRLSLPGRYTLPHSLAGVWGFLSATGAAGCLPSPLGGQWVKARCSVQ